MNSAKFLSKLTSDLNNTKIFQMLQQDDLVKIKLLRVFEEETVAGFFLVANGWKNKVAHGISAQYTDIP